MSQLALCEPVCGRPLGHWQSLPTHPSRPALFASRHMWCYAVRAPVWSGWGAVGSPHRHRHIPFEDSVQRADRKLGSTMGKWLALRGPTSHVRLDSGLRGSAPEVACSSAAYMAPRHEHGLVRGVPDLNGRVPSRPEDPLSKPVSNSGRPPSKPPASPWRGSPSLAASASTRQRGGRWLAPWVPRMVRHPIRPTPSSTGRRRVLSTGGVGSGASPSPLPSASPLALPGAP